MSAPCARAAATVFMDHMSLMAFHHLAIDYLRQQTLYYTIVRAFAGISSDTVYFDANDHMSEDGE